MLDEAEIIAISSNPSDLPDSKKEFPHRITLQNFGFVSNKSTSPTNNYPINKTKRSTYALLSYIQILNYIPGKNEGSKQMSF